MKYTLLAVILVLALYSCTTTNKLKTSHKEATKIETREATDSSSTTTLDSAGVRRTVISSTTETEDNYTKTTVIEFDTSKTAPLVNTEPLIDGSTPAEDYVTTIGDIRVKGRVRNVTVKETGKKTEKAKTETTATDTAAKKAVAATDLKKAAETKAESKSEDKSKKVFRIDATGLVIGSILLLILAAVVYYYRKRIGLFFSVLKFKIWPKNLPSRSSES